VSIARLQLVLDSQPMVTGARQTAEALRTVTTAGKQAEAATRGLGGAQRETVATVTRATQAQREHADALRRVSQGMESGRAAAALLGRALGGLTLLQIGRQFVETADRATLLAARLRLVASSTADAAATQAQLFRIAQQNGQSLEQLATVYTRIARAGREAGVSSDTMLQATEAIAAAMRVSGGDTASMNAALVQLAQGFASGTLRGEELNSVLEQAPRLAEAIAAGLGVTVGELQRLGQEGELKTVPVLQALVSQMGKLKEEAAGLPTTVGTAWDRITGASSKFVANLNEALGITPKIAAGLSAVADVIDRIAGLADTRSAFVRGSAFGRGLTNPELQSQIERYRNPNPLDLEAAADNDRRREVLAALLREQNRRRFTSRAAVTITAEAVTPAERRRLEREAADERESQFRWDQHRFDAPREAARRLRALRQSMGLDQGFDPEQFEGQGRTMGEFMDRYPEWRSNAMRRERGQDAAEQIRENLTRGMQSAVATFAEGLMTDGLSSARSFAAAFGTLLRRTVAEAIAGSLTQRFVTPFVNSFIGGGASAAGGGGGGAAAGAAAGGAGMAAGAAAFGVVAAAGLFIGALQEAASATQRFRDAQETASRSEASFRSRFLRATGRAGEADALDVAERERQELVDLERQRQEQLAATRRRLFTGAQQRKREQEINDRFDRLAEDLRKAQGAERDDMGGSIGDYNVTAGLNVAAIIGDIRRASLAGPEVPGGGVGGGRDGLTIVGDVTVVTQATDAESMFDEIRRVARARAQASFGSPSMAAEAFA
jgi:tape measure domain-containing protein